MTIARLKADWKQEFLEKRYGRIVTEILPIAYKTSEQREIEVQFKGIQNQFFRIDKLEEDFRALLAPEWAFKEIENKKQESRDSIARLKNQHDDLRGEIQILKRKIDRYLEKEKRTKRDQATALRKMRILIRRVRTLLGRAPLRRILSSENFSQNGLEMEISLLKAQQLEQLISKFVQQGSAELFIALREAEEDLLKNFQNLSSLYVKEKKDQPS